MHVVGPRNVWAVGLTAGKPLILRWNGIRWRLVTVPAPRRGGVIRVAGGGTRPLWLALHKGIYDWTERRWRLRVGAQQFIADVAVRGKSEAWAIVDKRDALGLDRKGSVVLHWDGVSWTRVPLPVRDLYKIELQGSLAWATGSHGDDELLLRWDGRWERVTGVTDPSAVSVAGKPPPYILSRGRPWRLGRLGRSSIPVPLSTQNAADLDVSHDLALVLGLDVVMVRRLAC